MRRILISAIGGDVGHSILKCLQKSNDYLIGCDVIDYPVGLDLVQKYYKISHATEEDYLERVLQICKDNQITHFIPVSEPEIKKVSDNRFLFNECGIKILINSEKIIDICLDKYKTGCFLNEHNIQKMKICLAKDYIDDGNNYIVKLRKSCGSKLLKVINNSEGLDECLNMYVAEDLVIQEYIDDSDEEYTVGIFGWNNDLRIIIFRRKLQGGFTKFVELVNDPVISSVCIKIAQVLELKGSINIQLRKKNNVCYVFEINPRLSGTTNFRNQLGFTDVIWWLEAIDGKTLNQYIPKYNYAIGIREMNEKFLIME